MMRTGLVRTAFAAMLWIAAALAADVQAGDDPARASVLEVDARMETAYVEVLGRHDAAIAAAPHDTSLSVARCAFIEAFIDVETGRYVHGAPEAFDECLAGLAASAPDAPPVRVYLLEHQRLGGIDEDSARALVAESADWPADLRRRLATEFYWSFHEDPFEGEMATMAAQLGNPHLVGRAVRHLARAGDHAAALALLANAPPADSDRAASARVEAALLLDDAGAALAELHRHQATGHEVDAVLAARAHLHAGDLEGARARLDASSLGFDAAAAVSFDIAFAAGDWVAAAAAIDLVRIDGFSAHLERFAKLVTASPAVLARPTLWPSLAALAAAALGLVLLPALLLFPVHYRGALRRLAGRPATPLFEPVGLRHAWMALAALMILPMLVVGLVAPAELATMLAEEAQPSGRTLLLASVWGGVLCMAALALPLMRFTTAGGFGWARLHRAWWRILLAWGLVLAVGALLAVFHQAQGADTETAQTRMVDTLIRGGRTPWEIMLAFLAIAVIAPLWEEIAFRGMLLGGMARHISFGWANVLQATVFALIHEDPPRFVFYLALGLLAGWLVRSTRSLAPAIALHALNNALAFVFIMR